jgi:hypothetical protein
MFFQNGEMEAMDKVYEEVSKMEKSINDNIQPEIKTAHQPLSKSPVSKTKGQKKGSENESINWRVKSGFE